MILVLTACGSGDSNVDRKDDDVPPPSEEPAPLPDPIDCDDCIADCWIDAGQCLGDQPVVLEIHAGWGSRSRQWVEGGYCPPTLGLTEPHTAFLRTELFDVRGDRWEWSGTDWIVTPWSADSVIREQHTPYYFADDIFTVAVRGLRGATPAELSRLRPRFDAQEGMSPYEETVTVSGDASGHAIYCQNYAGPLEAYLDRDGDGFTAPLGQLCPPGAPGLFEARQGSDCSDAEHHVHPQAVEVCDDGFDNDCDPTTVDACNAIEPDDAFAWSSERLVSIGDYDGDGKGDLVRLDGVGSVFFGPVKGDLDPRPPDLVLGGPLLAAAGLGDIDGDGLDEVGLSFAPGPWTIQDSAGESIVVTCGSLGEQGTCALHVEDRNGDGHRDLIFTERMGFSGCPPIFWNEEVFLHPWSPRDPRFKLTSRSNPDPDWLPRDIDGDGAAEPIRPDRWREWEVVGERWWFRRGATWAGDTDGDGGQEVLLKGGRHLWRP